MKVRPDPPQSSMFFIPKQEGIDFPLSLVEKYQPRKPEEFVGLARPKQLLANLIAKPRACSMLFLGAPGTGKSVMGMALAESLPGSLHHVSAQKCDVAALDSLYEKFAYSPPVGAWWVCLVDECDMMTERAQLQLLSRLDTSNALNPIMGGAMLRGVAPPVIWVFTANGRGPAGTEPPAGLSARFLERCMKVEFAPPSAGELAAYLEHVWKLEGGGRVPDGYFGYVGDGCSVREALQRLDTDLLAGCREKPRPIALAPTVITARTQRVTRPDRWVGWPRTPEAYIAFKRNRQARSGRMETATA